jgi:hypothetical protein
MFFYQKNNLGIQRSTDATDQWQIFPHIILRIVPTPGATDWLAQVDTNPWTPQFANQWRPLFAGIL